MIQTYNTFLKLSKNFQKTFLQVIHINLLITFKIIFKNFQNNCIIIASMETTIKHISVSTTRMYGLFKITGNVNGEWITTTTTDSFIFDNRNGYDCDSEEELLSHEQAMEFCKMRLLEKYNL